MRFESGHQIIVELDTNDEDFVYELSQIIEKIVSLTAVSHVVRTVMDTAENDSEVGC